MKKVMIVAFVLVLGFGMVAMAKKPANPGAGGACVQAGIGFLQENGLLTVAAQKGIDYGTLGPSGAGLIAVDLPEGTFLSLGQVVKLHTTNPELFSWCD